jgi:hypothetical protein
VSYPFTDPIGSAPFEWQISGGYAVPNPISAPGKGYTSAPTVSFPNVTYGLGNYNHAPTATATVSGGSVVSINYSNLGQNLASIGTIVLSGGGGTGAACSASVSNNMLTGGIGTVNYGEADPLYYDVSDSDQAIAGKFAIADTSTGSRMILMARYTVSGSQWYVLYGYQNSGDNTIYLTLIYVNGGTTTNLTTWHTGITWTIGHQVSVALTATGSSPTTLQAFCNDDDDMLYSGESLVGSWPMAPEFSSSTYSDSSSGVQTATCVGTAGFGHLLQISELTAYDDGAATRTPRPAADLNAAKSHGRSAFRSVKRAK